MNNGVGVILELQSQALHRRLKCLRPPWQNNKSQDSGLKYGKGDESKSLGRVSVGRFHHAQQIIEGRRNA